MPKEHQVTFCSVSDQYIVYTVQDMQSSEAHPELQIEDNKAQADLAKSTLVVIIDVANK